MFLYGCSGAVCGWRLCIRRLVLLTLAHGRLDPQAGLPIREDLYTVYFLSAILETLLYFSVYAKKMRTLILQYNFIYNIFLLTPI